MSLPKLRLPAISSPGARPRASPARTGAAVTASSARKPPAAEVETKTRSGSKTARPPAQEEKKVASSSKTARSPAQEEKKSASGSKTTRAGKAKKPPPPPLSEEDERQLVEQLFLKARVSAETGGSRRQLQADSAGLHTVNWLRQHCECVKHGATKKSLLRLFVTLEATRGWPMAVFRCIVDYVPLHEFKSQASLCGRWFKYDTHSQQKPTSVNVRLFMHIDGSFEYCFNEETLLVPQREPGMGRSRRDRSKEPRLVDRERIKGEWYRVGRVLTLVYEESQWMRFESREPPAPRDEFALFDADDSRLPAVAARDSAAASAAPVRLPALTGPSAGAASAAVTSPEAGGRVGSSAAVSSAAAVVDPADAEIVRTEFSAPEELGREHRWLSPAKFRQWRGFECWVFHEFEIRVSADGLGLPRLVNISGPFRFEPGPWSAHNHPQRESYYTKKPLHGIPVVLTLAEDAQGQAAPHALEFSPHARSLRASLPRAAAASAARKAETGAAGTSASSIAAAASSGQ